VMGSGLLFPAKGAWRLSPETIALLEERFEQEIGQLRQQIKSYEPPHKLTLCGPLRSYFASDHADEMLRMPGGLLHGAVHIGPPAGRA
jgi:hypothetical protein